MEGGVLLPRDRLDKEKNWNIQPAGRIREQARKGGKGKEEKR
jgi:hypothetical protein